ncbi:oligoendopeptidase F [Oscillospiraceae bacterium HV4-5-C5C]|nr:oligoendopeptidase F [Oscillospiraceae bacterium HV4-5-C5C]
MTDNKKTLVLRQAADPAQTWDVKQIFASDQDWLEAYDTLIKRLPEFNEFKGKLGASASSLRQALQLQTELSIPLGKLYVYAHLRHDEDTANPAYIELQSKAQALLAQASAVFSYVDPELAEIPEATVTSFMQQDPALEQYRHLFDNLIRNASHILSDQEEFLLAQLSEALNASSNTFSTLNDSDFVFPSVKDEQGTAIELNHAVYGTLLESQDRRVRQDAFQGLYKVYHQFRNTLASTLAGEVKSHNALAKIRRFPTARAAALFQNNIPESVFDNLLSTVNDHLDLLHRYVGFRQKTLGLDELHSYDLYVSLVRDIDVHYSFEAACELMLKALEPLGETYLAVVRRALKERWIDYVPNKGKRSGAYSSGTYGTYPYILMSWQGTLDNVFTLVHEMGHSVHSYFTRENQPYHYADYSIFLAEIASTTNENLLTAYLLKTETDPRLRAYVVNHYLDGFKGTVFRQTQFAEFEHLIHKADQEGEALTADFMSEAYARINRRYYGASLTEDPEIRLEWSRIPHFYYNYYVFQYATGFSAATAFSQAVLNEGKPAVERYIGYLKAGNSDYPLNVLKKAGLDMSQPAPVEAALSTFGRYLDELEQTVL